MFCLFLSFSFAASSSDIEIFLEGRTIDVAFEERRLFLVNHKILDGLSDVQNYAKVGMQIIYAFSLKLQYSTFLILCHPHIWSFLK